MPHSITITWEHDGKQIARMRVFQTIERPMEELLVTGAAMWMKEKIKAHLESASAVPASDGESRAGAIAGPPCCP
jgi:hypothetical protein